MGQIFISYRRSDSAGHAGRLYDRLTHWFDEPVLFFDRESIKAGELFSKRIETAILQAKAILVVIAPEWLNTTNLERLHRDDDVVRGELALAMSLFAENNSPQIIPVLCGGAEVPAIVKLPDDIHKLCDHHFHTIEETSYGPTFSKLLDRLKEIGLTPAFRYRHDGDHPFHTNGPV